MKVDTPTGAQLSGRIGNMIYYTRNGKTYARRAAIPGKKRKWETEGRHERNVAASNRFAVMQRMYSAFARKVSADIWRIAARAEGKMAANLFHSENFACIDGQGRMANPEAFRFTEGELTLPPGLRVRRAEPPASGEPADEGWWEVAWEAEEEWSLAAATDRLMAGVLYATDPLTPCPAAETSGRRGDGHGRFRLDPEAGLPAHVYLYFAREDGTAYSPSRHFLAETPSAERQEH